MGFFDGFDSTPTRGSSDDPDSGDDAPDVDYGGGGGGGGGGGNSTSTNSTSTNQTTTISTTGFAANNDYRLDIGSSNESESDSGDDFPSPGEEGFEDRQYANANGTRTANGQEVASEPQRVEVEVQGNYVTPEALQETVEEQKESLQTALDQQAESFEQATEEQREYFENLNEQQKEQFLKLLEEQGISFSQAIEKQREISKTALAGVKTLSARQRQNFAAKYPMVTLVVVGVVIYMTYRRYS